MRGWRGSGRKYNFVGEEVNGTRLSYRCVVRLRSVRLNEDGTGRCIRGELSARSTRRPRDQLQCRSLESPDNQGKQLYHGLWYKLSRACGPWCQGK